MNRVSLLPALLLLFLSACTGAPDSLAPHNAGVIDDPASKAESAAQPDGTIDAEAPETDEIGPPPILVYERSITLDGEEFLLRFLGAEDGDAFYTRLQILDPAVDSLLYQTSLLVGFWDHGVFPAIIEGREYEFDIVDLVDMDFDGHTDIRVAHFRGRRNIEYVYILRDPATGGFIDDPYGLAYLESPAFRGESRLVLSSRVDPEASWGFEHEYRDGLLIVVGENAYRGMVVPKELVEQVQAIVPAYNEDRDLVHLSRRDLDEERQTLVMTEAWYLVENRRTGEVFARFDADTAQGKALFELLHEHQYGDFWK